MSQKQCHCLTSVHSSNLAEKHNQTDQFDLFAPLSSLGSGIAHLMDEISPDKQDTAKNKRHGSNPPEHLVMGNVIFQQVGRRMSGRQRGDDQRREIVATNDPYPLLLTELFSSQSSPTEQSRATASSS